ncbi:hypothetical protein [Emticicia fontis]
MVLSARKPEKTSAYFTTDFDLVIKTGTQFLGSQATVALLRLAATSCVSLSALVF